jgi:hypothetical protein
VRIVNQARAEHQFEQDAQRQQGQRMHVDHMRTLTQRHSDHAGAELGKLEQLERQARRQAAAPYFQAVQRALRVQHLTLDQPIGMQCNNSHTVKQTLFQ